MRWGPPKEKKKKATYKLWFAWYPVELYSGRWMWWEWCIRHRERIVSPNGNRVIIWAYETFFDGKIPEGMNKKVALRGWQ